MEYGTSTTRKRIILIMHEVMASITRSVVSAIVNYDYGNLLRVAGIDCEWAGTVGAQSFDQSTHQEPVAI